jgi:hypothetical protein
LKQTSVKLRVRASIAQSLVRSVGKMPGVMAQAFSQELRNDESTQRIMMLAPIGWVEEEPFLELLSNAHRQLADAAYIEAVHDASMVMLKLGVFRAAQAAFTLFKKPGLSAYAKWAERMWTLSFQGLALVYEREDEAGVHMILSAPPACGFTKSLVLGTSGILRTVFTLTRSAGQVQVQHYRTNSAEVRFCLRRDDSGAKRAEAR